MKFATFSNWRSLLKFDLARVFTMDVRSLAVVRILVGIIILIDLASRARDITMFYGDGGVIPSSLLHSFSPGLFAWSLHLLDGGSFYLVSSLFVLNVLSALALLLGYKTRVATIVTWVLTVSLHNTNPLILQGGDVLLRGILFVGMFLPWGAVFSIDRAFAKGKSIQTQILSGWTAAFLLQIGFMYYFASFFKDSVEWNNGTAIYYTLSIDQYATPVARFLLRFPEFLTYLTHTIHWYQHVALFLLFSPILTKYIRTATAVSLMLMHFSFALCMHLGMFSWISMVALVGFIPREAWDFLADRARSRFGVLASYLDLSHYAAISTYEVDMNVWKQVASTLISSLGIAYILYLFTWQASNVVMLKHPIASDTWQIPAKVLRIDQRWNLFAPRPYKDDGWYVLLGTKKNDEQIDLYRNGEPVSFERPENLFRIYPNTRWRKFGIEVRNQNNARYRPYYAEYLCRSWNSAHEGEQEIESVEVMYMLERTPVPGEQAEPARPVSLISRTCGNESQ